MYSPTVDLVYSEFGVGAFTEGPINNLCDYVFRRKLFDEYVVELQVTMDDTHWLVCFNMHVFEVFDVFIQLKIALEVH